MRDEEILEFLRARSQVRPPLDLAAAVFDATEGVQQRGPSWIVPFVPAFGAVGVAAVVLVAAILVGQGPRDAGPGPGASPSQTEAAPPISSPTPTATPTPSPAPALTEADATLTFDAVDSEGTWGSVTLSGRQEVGGYADGVVSTDSFVVEVRVDYVADREPVPFEFGDVDWALRPVGEILAPHPRREASRPSLGTYPGAIDIFSNDLGGWLLFVVPRDAADEPLDLVYQPPGVEEPVAVIRIREPGEAPAPVPDTSFTPPPDVTYIEQAGYPITVIDSPEVEELFSEPDTCSNDEVGYTVTYPDAWYDNTPIGEWPACSWFSATFYDVSEDPNEVPPQIDITAIYVDGGIGTFDETVFSEELEVGGYAARRVEQRGGQGEGEALTVEWYSYTYQVDLGASQDGTGPFVVFSTSTDMGGDYVLNKAVLDRMMALIEFDR